MPTCQKCNAVVFSGDTFCGVCGSAIPVSIFSGQRSCPNCHALAVPEDVFCGSCGAALPKESLKPKKTCTKCQTIMELEDTFCGVCGCRSDIVDPNSSGTVAITSPLSQPHTQSSGNENETQQSRNTSLRPTATTPNRSFSSPAGPRAPQSAKSPVSSPSFSYGQDSKSKGGNKKALLLIGGAVGALVLIIIVAIAGFIGYKWYDNNSFGSKIETALSSNKIFSPPGDCVSDLVANEKAKNPQSTKIAEYADKIISTVEPPAEKALQNWYKDSDQATNWNDLERSFLLLCTINPDSKDYLSKYFYVLGQKAINGNDFEKARDNYLRAVEKNPDWALPLNGLGKIYIRDDSPFKDVSQAVSYYQKATEVDPNFTWANVNLATYYRQQGNLSKAKEYMQNAINSYPTKSSLFISMGNICVKMGNSYEADWYFKKALEYETDETKKEQLRNAIQNLQ